MPPALCAVFVPYFSDRVSWFLPGPASDQDPPPYTSLIPVIIGIYHHAQLVC
jgi:hypothetical protein